MNAVLATPAAAAPLACEHIVKRYDGHTVLSDVTLSIPRGAVLGRRRAKSRQLAARRAAARPG